MASEALRSDLSELPTGPPKQIRPFPPGFDIRRQSIVIYRENGTAFPSTPICCNSTSIDFFWRSGFEFQYQYGAIFGMCLCMFLLLIVLTPPPKRRLSLFILECVSLVLIMIRMLADTEVYTNSIFGEFLMTVDWQYSMIRPHDEIGLGISSIIPWLLQVTVYSCLFIQSRTILTAVRPRNRRIILSLLLVVTLTAYGCRAYGLYFGLKQVVLPTTLPASLKMQSLGTWAVTSAIICYSGVFSWNVFRTIQARAKMGLHRADALGILMLVSIESMLLPLFFAIIENFPNEIAIPDPSGLVFVVVALCLPFGSLWAGAISYHAHVAKETAIRNGTDVEPTRNNSHTVIDNRSYNSNRKLVSSSGMNAFDGPSALPQMTQAYRTSSNRTNNAAAARSGLSPEHSSPNSDELEKLYPDFKYKNGIQVNREYHVSTEDATKSSSSLEHNNMV